VVRFELMPNIHERPIKSLHLRGAVAAAFTP
jgi:hypothetical protein